eukprot:759064-Hanusia_phi.AAC.3
MRGGQARLPSSSSPLQLSAKKLLDERQAGGCERWAFASREFLPGTKGRREEEDGRTGGV